MTDLPKGVSLVLPTASKSAGDLLNQIIEATIGYEPAAQRHDQHVQRALYPPARMDKMIVNVSAEAIMEKLHWPQACVALESDDPLLYSGLACQTALEAGFDAKVIGADEVEISIPKDFMFFVQITDPETGRYALPLLLFPPVNPTQGQLKQVTKSDPWAGKFPKK